MRHAQSLSTALLLVSSVHHAVAWGVAVNVDECDIAGHQIVATIAQVHLHPSTRQAIRNILPEYTRGNLAPIAAWPDRVRASFPWSGQLHYATPVEPEHPPQDCTFDGAFKSDRNVLAAIHNYTLRVALERNDIDLRFLVHYIGDVHQPLHLTGRERGGNGDPVIFEGRHMSLHGLWDTQLLTKSIREIRNYTQPLPSSQIEGALTGAIYDPYVRWIVWEGIRLWWRNDLSKWLSCPAKTQQATPKLIMQDSTHPVSAPHASPDPINYVCPEAWAPEVHRYCCSHVYPPDYDAVKIPRELNTRAYHGKIVDDKIVEKLLAMGGIRLAAVLNTMLADPEELTIFGVVNPWAYAPDTDTHQHANIVS